MKKCLGILSICTTLVGISLNIMQILASGYSHPILSMGIPITLIGSGGCLLYARSIHKK
ncbi:Uncharacterised protein [Corynebacterium kutscheri]|uniref:Uncharacterized protein n=1 Tax=Corynebacterium kutscheri TaxID=35755 RepID=A0A0F6QY60_9CORY|nr:hypothetical protein [Corynebacterium kutscheri]AKE40372.1 hypothetical protein UL82_00680 [Corynebacterium kutscheri]VEH05337.1 Uncharacterised protein [Corynebacterium kutscheri]VEH10766.1 Uncharacterised protein [Corynebacterium kutscheri]VEH80754.1 Uncharacterised protein [Corynebacterium kutscheri]